MNTPIDLAALKGFTPGPWHTGGIFNPCDERPTQWVWGPIATEPEGCQSGPCIARDATIKDAALIAAAPQLYAELVEARAALRKISCIFCGHVVLVDDEGAKDKLADHIATCKKSPLVALVQQIGAVAGQCIDFVIKCTNGEGVSHEIKAEAEKLLVELNGELSNPEVEVS